MNEPKRGFAPMRWYLALLVFAGALSMVAFAARAAVSVDSAVPANSPQMARLLHRLQQHYQATESFTAQFKQTLTSTGGMTRQRSGKIAYRKAGKVRWAYDGTPAELIVADGTTLYDYDPGLNQVLEMPLQEAFKSRNAAAFILGAGNLERDFTAQAAASSSDGLERIILTPKGGGDHIELELDAATLNIVNLRMTDGLGNSNTIALSAIRLNDPLAASLFQFTPPTGTDVVRPSPRQ